MKTKQKTSPNLNKTLYGVNRKQTEHLESTSAAVILQVSSCNQKFQGTNCFSTNVKGNFPIYFRELA